MADKQVPFITITELPKDTTNPNSTEDRTVTSDPSKKVYTQEPYRWVSMIAFILIAFANGNTYVFFSTITAKTVTAYNVPVVMVYMCVVLYGWIYPFASIALATFIISRYSANVALILGGGCVLCYAWIRCLMIYKFWIVLIGAILGAIG